MTPEELSHQVRETFAYAARYISLLVLNNPQGTPVSVLGRPDVSAVITDVLAQARELAEDTVRSAWAAGGGTQNVYLEWLLADVVSSYGSLTVLRQAIHAAWESVPNVAFTPGIHQPGEHPAQRAAEERARAVRERILAYAGEAALRNQLSAHVAEVAARSEAVLAEGRQRELAGEKVFKRWRTKHDPPDSQTCHWCVLLNGVIVPLRGNFPSGTPVDLTGHGRLTRPPRLYHGILHGPPRHPRCRCRIELVVQEESGQGAAATAVTGTPPPRVPGFLSASEIRAMPEPQYRSLLTFLQAAVHELGQMLRRLGRVGR